MAILYDTATLLDTIRSLSSISNVQAQGSDDVQLIRYINDVIRGKIVPILLRVREEYLVQTVRVPLTSGITKYRIPNRSIGNRLRDVTYVDASGNRIIWGSRQISREQLPFYNTTGAAVPHGWYLEGNYVQIVPTSGTYTGSLEMAYYQRPSTLVAASAVGVIASVGGANQVTLTAAPPSTFVSGVKLDIHSAQSGAEAKFIDLTQNGAPAGNVITFLENVDGSSFDTVAAVAGDYLCLQNECGLVQVPDDMVPLLADGVALRCALADGDTEKAQLHSGMMRDESEEVLHLLQNRVDGKPQRILGYRGIRGWSG